MSVLAVIGAVLLTILKVIGWILLGVVALVLFALCVRVKLYVEYSAENTSVLLKWLFLKFKLYPMQKKEKKPKKKKEKTEPEAPAEEEEQEEEAAEKKEEQPAKKKDNMLVTFYNAEGLEGVLTLLKKACSYLKTFAGNMIAGVVVDEFYLDVRCVKGDAAATAIYYGEVCTAIFPLLASLASRCRLKKYDVNVYPDFLARYSDASFVLRFHITPIYYIGVVIAFGVKMLFGVLLKLLLPKKAKKSAQEPEIKGKPGPEPAAQNALPAATEAPEVPNPEEKSDEQ